MSTTPHATQALAQAVADVDRALAALVTDATEARDRLRRMERPGAGIGGRVVETAAGDVERAAARLTALLDLASTLGLTNDAARAAYGAALDGQVAAR